MVVSTVATNGGYLLWQNPHQSLHVILASACPEPQALWSVQLGLAASGAEWRHRGMPRNLGQRYKVNCSDPWKLEKYPKLGSNYGLYMNIFSREVRSIHYGDSNPVQNLARIVHPKPHVKRRVGGMIRLQLKWAELGTFITLGTISWVGGWSWFTSASLYFSFAIRLFNIAMENHHF